MEKISRRNEKILAPFFGDFGLRFGRFSVRFSACAIGASVFLPVSSPLCPLPFLTNCRFFGQKIFFREEKTSSHFFSFAVFLIALTRANILYIRSLLSSFLGGSPFLRGLFFVEPVEKDFERFVCKEKRRTFVTAKAIPARLIEELFRRARRDSFLGGGSGDELFLERQP